MQEPVDLNDLTVQKYFKKKKAYEKVYTSLENYKHQNIDSWFVYMDYASFGVFISLMGLFVSVPMLYLNDEACKNSQEPIFPGGLTFVISAVSALLNLLFIGITNQMRLDSDHIVWLDEEKKEEMEQLLAWFDIKPPKKVISSLEELTYIKITIEDRVTARLAFLSCLNHPDSTIPVTIPKEIVHLIFQYAGLLSTATNQLLDEEDVEVNTLTAS